MPFRRKIKKFYLAASAGTGQYIDSDAYETIEVGDEVSSLADFGITIAGNSMEPQFVNGQTVWVHSQESLNAGEIGIFLYEGQASSADVRPLCLIRMKCPGVLRGEVTP